MFTEICSSIETVYLREIEREKNAQKEDTNKIDEIYYSL